MPYGEGKLTIQLEEAIIMESRKVEPLKDLETEVRHTLENPIESPSLRKLLEKAEKVLLILPDHTRAFPAKEVLPILLDYIRKVKPDVSLKILVATGLHLPLTDDQLREMLGKEVVENYEVTSHDASDEDQVIDLGKKTSYGTPVQVNKHVMDSDLVIATGLIEPHFFAGYSGGRKSLLPGVAGKDSILRNHGFRMVGDPKARAGVLEGNPIHEDMLEFMKLTKLDFILNVTINKEKKVTGVFSGDPVKAHLAGVNALESYVKVQFREEADLVITTNGGYPLDRDIYQAVKGMDTAASVVKEGGVIIIAAECRDGLGGHEEFLKLVKGSKDADEILERIRRLEPIIDQWEAQVLARDLKKARIILVSDRISADIARGLLLEPAKSLEEALEIAYRTLGRRRDLKTIVIPEGPYVVPVKEAR